MAIRHNVMDFFASRIEALASINWQRKVLEVGRCALLDPGRKRTSTWADVRLRGRAALSRSYGLSRTRKLECQLFRESRQLRI